MIHQCALEKKKKYQSSQQDMDLEDLGIRDHH